MVIVKLYLESQPIWYKHLLDYNTTELIWAKTSYNIIKLQMNQAISLV